MSAPTPEEIAHWPAPNYVNPSTRVPALIGVMTSFTVAMLPFVIARIHMRLRLKGRLRIDDWVIINSAACDTQTYYLHFYVTNTFIVDTQHRLHGSCNICD